MTEKRKMGQENRMTLANKASIEPPWKATHFIKLS